MKERKQNKEKSLSPKYLQKGQEQAKILYVTKDREQWKAAWEEMQGRMYTVLLSILKWLLIEKY